jgi:uncharacterized protein
MGREVVQGMKIQVGGLSEGGHQYHFDAPAGEIGLGEEFSEVHADVVLDKTANQIALNATVHTSANFTCDRCTAPFASPLSSSYRMHYIWNDEDASQYDVAEVQVIPQGSTIIDITEDVRQTVLIAVPLKLLCREDCLGLCPYCGKDLNEGLCECRPEEPDSRWEKLRALQDRKSQDPR